MSADLHSSRRAPQRPAEDRRATVLQVHDVPPQIATCDATLRLFAGQLLQQRAVRSVTVHRERCEVIVHTAGDQAPTIKPAGGALPEIFVWHDPAQPIAYCVRAPRAVAGWRKGLYLLGGTLAIALAALGVILPGVPTTPFVLLASYCLVRSSPRWHERLLRNRVFGGILRDWYLHRGLRPHIRYKALAILALVVASSLYWGGLPPWANLLITAIAACGAAYVWRLPDVVE